MPEFLTYRKNLEDEQANYRMTADADIKSVIQGLRGRFTIEGQPANEKMEIIANESRARDEVIGSSMAALDNKIDKVIQELQLPRTGERELKTKQIELQPQINEVLIRLQELGTAISQVRGQGGGKGEWMQQPHPPAVQQKRTLIDPKFMRVPDLNNEMCHREGAFNRWRKTWRTALMPSTPSSRILSEQSGGTKLR